VAAFFCNREKPLLAATRTAEVEPVILDDRDRFDPVLVREPGVEYPTGGCGAWFPGGRSSGWAVEVGHRYRYWY
jgi:hypothetical protein